MQDLDLRTPSYQAAFHFAKEAGLASARAAGRPKMNEADRAVAGREFARLLWHVRFDDGGFKGADDFQREEMCARNPILSTLDEATITAGLWSPGAWPESEFATFSEFERHAAQAAA